MAVSGLFQNDKPPRSTVSLLHEKLASTEQLHFAYVSGVTECILWIREPCSHNLLIENINVALYF